MLVIDESTCYKNPTAKRSKAIAKLRDSFSHATCMSGTPTPQGIIDLWHQMYLVDQGKLLGNSYYRFRASTHTPVNKGAFTEWVEKEGVADAIADIISEKFIRNAREDCMDLPENLVVHRNYKLSPSHLKVYLDMKRHACIELASGDVNAVNAAVLLSKLLQIASGAVYDEFGHTHLVDTTRYELIMDLVDERDHSVVFFNFKHQKEEFIKIAEKNKMKYAVIDGEVSGSKRTDAVNDFQAGKLKVLFCHPQSAGHGITLTRGTATIWASPTYNVEHFEQANARIFRGGQTKKTETILISAEGTADKKAYAALFEKQLNMNNLLEVLR
jgi:SNF2 family DNA or RNA helicase